MRIPTRSQVQRFIRKAREQRPYHGAGMLLYSSNASGRLQVLLGQRAINPGAGTWSIPGGKLKGGETFWQGARREVGEELPIPQAQFGSGMESEFPSVRIVIPLLFYWQTFLVPMSASETELRWSDEFVECRWFAVDALPEPLHYGTRRAVRRLLKQRNQ